VQGHKCLIFGEERFYRFSADASKYFDFKIETEPQLKLAKNITENISGNYIYRETGLGRTWNYKLNIYIKGADFFGDLEIIGPETNINVVTKIDGLPDGRLNVLFDSYKNENSGKLFTKCYRNNCGREAIIDDVLFVLERQGAGYRISWGEFYPYVEKSKDSKTEFFVNQ
jgi:hypothetical protein